MFSTTPTLTSNQASVNFSATVGSYFPFLDSRFTTYYAGRISGDFCLGFNYDNNYLQCVASGPHPFPPLATAAATLVKRGVKSRL